MKLTISLLLFILLHIPGPAQSDFFTPMGLSQDDARDHILDSVISGQAPYQLVTRAFLAAPVQTRMAWIRGIFVWARAYTRTEAFLGEYLTRREESAPGAEAKAVSFDEEMAGQQAEFRKQVEEMRKNITQMPAEMRPQMEQTIRDMEAQFKEQNENPQIREIMRQGHQEMQTQRQADYQQRLAEYERNYPRQPRQLIIRHLQSFLELSGRIDFAARTELRDGFQKFINPLYESSSKEWKLLYRAGRETVEAARAEAQIWLTELGARQ